MRATDIIRAKRDGEALSREAIEFFVAGVTDGSFPNYQASALLMAIVLKGMTTDETAWLTSAMVRSGIKVDLSAIPGVKVDKHSTGGVGDKASLVAGAAGGGVRREGADDVGPRPRAHGRHARQARSRSPGFRVDLSLEEMIAALEKTGVAMLGQTKQIAPADKTLYALRDVTGTVESIPLITASIMSKKIAEGIDALVLDVKTGRGAFMKTVEDSRRLARSLVDTGNRSGVRTEALITAMDAPLGGRGRQRDGSGGVRRDAEGARAEGPRGAVGGAGRADGAGGGPGERPGRRGREGAEGAGVGGGRREVARDRGAAGRRPAHGGRLRPDAVGADAAHGEGGPRRLPVGAARRAGRARDAGAGRRAQQGRRRGGPGGGGDGVGSSWGPGARGRPDHRAALPARATARGHWSAAHRDRRRPPAAAVDRRRSDAASRHAAAAARVRRGSSARRARPRRRTYSGLREPAARPRPDRSRSECM